MVRLGMCMRALEGASSQAGVSHLVQLFFQHSWMLLDLIHECTHEFIDQLRADWELIHPHAHMRLASIVQRLRQNSDQYHSGCLHGAERARALLRHLWICGDSPSQT